MATQYRSDRDASVPVQRCLWGGAEMSNWSLRAGSVLFTLAVLLLWQLVTTAGLVQPIFMPTPTSTFVDLWRGLTRGDLLALTISTMERMIFGWLLASLGGILLGALIGLSPR